jgi:hypothetical protein
LRRVLAGLCAVVLGLVLALQLVGAAFHDHDLAEQLPDCVSCHLSSHSNADLPAVTLQLLALFLVVAFVLARLPRPLPVVLRCYLIPSRQAPPRHRSVH